MNPHVSIKRITLQHGELAYRVVVAVDADNTDDRMEWPAITISLKQAKAIASAIEERETE